MCYQQFKDVCCNSRSLTVCDGLQGMFANQVVGSKFVFGMIIKGGEQSDMPDVFVKVMQKLFPSSYMVASPGSACLVSEWASSHTGS